MTIAHVQDTPGSGTTTKANAASLAVTAFSSPVVLGNIVVVWVAGSNTSAPPTTDQFTCTDNAIVPNPYIQIKFIGNTSANGQCAAIIFVATIANNPASGNLNPTVSNSGGTPQLDICAAEFSGASTSVDGTSSNTGTVSPVTGGNLTTTGAGDLLLAVAGLKQATNLITFPDPTGAGTWTKVGSNLSGPAMWAGYQIPGAIVTNQNPSWAPTTMTNATWAAVQAALGLPVPFPTIPVTPFNNFRAVQVAITPTPALAGGPIGLIRKKRIIHPGIEWSKRNLRVAA